MLRVLGAAAWVTMLLLAGCRSPQLPGAGSALPQHPQRLVVPAPQVFEDVLSLGVLPAGTTIPYGDRPMLSPAQWHAITPLVEPVNVEQVLTLHPDLIMTVPPDATPALREIAPTYLVRDFTNFSNWETRQREVARVLGMSAQAERGIADYNRKLAEVRRDFRGHRIRVLMAYVRSDTRSIAIFSDRQNTAHILEAVGLQYGGIDGHPIRARSSQNISWEQVGELDCDAFFVVPAPSDTTRTREDVSSQLALLADQPLWNRMPFVRKGHVYSMDPYWQMLSPLSAERILADLEGTLLGRDINAEWHLHAPAGGWAGRLSEPPRPAGKAVSP